MLMVVYTRLDHWSGQVFASVRCRMRDASRSKAGRIACVQCTMYAQTVAEEAGASMFAITAASITGAYLGESERRMRKVFERAQEAALAQQVPAIVFLDEADTLCAKRGAALGHGDRVVTQLLALLDAPEERQVRCSAPQCCSYSARVDDVPHMLPM